MFLDMLSRPDLQAEFSRFDEEGNRIDKRRLPDGSEFEVIKNFHSESEIEQQLSGYARDLEFYEFDGLNLPRLVLFRL